MHEKAMAANHPAEKPQSFKSPKLRCVTCYQRDFLISLSRRTVTKKYQSERKGRRNLDMAIE